MTNEEIGTVKANALIRILQEDFDWEPGQPMPPGMELLNRVRARLRERPPFTYPGGQD